MSSKKVQSNKKNTDKMRSVRKEKPHLNMPANFKVSIPYSSPEQEGVHIPILKGRRPPLYTKHLDTRTKVELANSVARQQLIKEEPPAFQPDNVVIIKAPQVSKQTRGRKKKAAVVSDFFQNRIVTENNSAGTSLVCSTDTTLPQKDTPEKKPTTANKRTTPRKPIAPRKILTRKRLADSKAHEDANCANVEPTNTETLGSKRIKLEENTQAFDLPEEPAYEPYVEQPTVVPAPVVEKPTPPIVAQPELKVVQQQPKKPKPTVKRLQPTPKKPPAVKPGPARKKAAKGKQQNSQPHVQTPSIVDLLKNQAAEAEEKLKQNQPTPPESVEPNENSVGSNSWTRDISSSSTNTWVGSVCSNDFVRIDNKLPILKLTNIDSEVKKRQNEALEAASAAADETDEDLSDSYDSSSSKSRVRKFSEQLNESLGANSLHLSASSSSQIINSRRKATSSDYKKASNKLSQTMEKLDLEIIQWMGSDNEDVSENLVKFRDKMFDILDREFGVITHCRHLKEILNPRKKDDFDEACVPEYIRDCDANDYIEHALVEDVTPVEKSAPVKKNTPVKQNTSVKQNIPIETITKDLEKKIVEPRKGPSRQLSSNSEGNVSNASTRASKDANSDDELEAGASDDPLYDHHDDDDTLSLYAESITGFESSRMCTSGSSAVTSKPPPVEEYIPEPVKQVYPLNTEKQTYCPTKIREDTQTIASKLIKTVCEKQNADSTSIYKQSNSTDDAESYPDLPEDIYFDTRSVGAPEVIIKPRLMESYFEELPKTRSMVFSNLCFYFLMNCCRKNYNGQCRFLHLKPTSEQIKEKLSHLDERMLIQEYLLLRKWAELRRRYGMCYVEECAKRGFTRILVEMAYDFIVKARNESEEDTRLRVNTIEVTLLHLNNVDLSVCEDLLKLSIPHHSDQANKTLLCDVFMATMSITQNFSRFKMVFMTLTYFMVDNDRTFNKDVVEHILERVCILPFDEPVARALMQMMRLTKADIFNNSMIGHFEKQISVNKDVFEEYTQLKNDITFSSLVASSLMASSLQEEASQPEPQPPAASPDTTNLDPLNKSTDEAPKPIITRTIGKNPPIVFNWTASSPGDSTKHVNPGPSQINNSPSKSYVSPSGPHGKNTGTDSSDHSVNMGMWRNRSIFSRLPPPPMLVRGGMHSHLTLGTPPHGAMKPPMRPQMGPSQMRSPQMRTPQMRPPQMRPPQVRPSHRAPFNQRLVTFKSPSNNATRQSGPQY